MNKFFVLKLGTNMIVFEAPTEREVFNWIQIETLSEDNFNPIDLGYLILIVL